MAKKTKKVATGKVDDPNTPGDESVEEVEIEVDPDTQIAVDWGGTGNYTIIDAPVLEDGTPDIRSRHVHLQGKTFEHVAEHKGVWAYRHLG